MIVKLSIILESSVFRYEDCSACDTQSPALVSHLSLWLLLLLLLLLLLFMMILLLSMQIVLNRLNNS